MRVPRSLPAVTLLAAALLGTAGCGGPTDDERAAQRANDVVPTTTIDDVNEKLDQADEKSAELLKKEQARSAGAVKDVKEIVDGAVERTVDGADAEARAKTEAARQAALDLQADAKAAADQAIAGARKEAEKAGSSAADALKDVQGDIDRARDDISDAVPDIPTTEDEEGSALR